jgi:hypothetical protein
MRHAIKSNRSDPGNAGNWDRTIEVVDHGPTSDHHFVTFISSENEPGHPAKSTFSNYSMKALAELSMVLDVLTTGSKYVDEGTFEPVEEAVEEASCPCEWRVYNPETNATYGYFPSWGMASHTRSAMGWVSLTTISRVK